VLVDFGSLTSFVNFLRQTTLAIRQLLGVSLRDAFTYNLRNIVSHRQQQQVIQDKPAMAGK